MPRIPIYDPTRGMFTAADQQDLDPRAGFADLVENLYLDRPGKARKRDGLDQFTTNLSTKTVKGFLRFVDENLTNNAEWVAYVALSGTDRIWTAAVATFAEQVSGLTEVTVGKLDTTVVSGKLRLAFGYTSHRIYLYNQINDFFQNLYQPASAWAWGTRQPTYPSTFTYNDLYWTEREFGSGVITNSTILQYKLVPIFDGVQESLFASGKAVLDIGDDVASGDYGVVVLEMIFDSADWLKRITHLNIYRQHSTDPGQVDDALYQLVDTISTANDDPLTSITGAATMENRMYDGTKSWGVNDYAFDNGVGGGTYESPNIGDIRYRIYFSGEGIRASQETRFISSNTANIITHLSSVIPIFNAATYTIYSNTCVSNGTWAGATEAEVDSGTKGYGGEFAWYSATATLIESSLKYQIVQYQTTEHSAIIGNADKVIVIGPVGTTNPTNNTGLTIKYAPYIYYKSGTTYTLFWADYGRLIKGPHPQAGVTTITAAAKYSVYWKGRLFGLNARVTKADATTEDFPDALVHTEVNQLDVWPPDFQLQQPTDRGGIGQGLEVIEEVETLVLFFRNAVSFLRVPLADPDSWRMWSSERALGLVNPDSMVKTSRGIFFCSDEGLYLIDKGGRISQQPISYPIDDSYKTAAAAGVTGFSLIYYPQQRQLWFSPAATGAYVWVLDIDSIDDTVPRWTKYTWGSSKTLSISAIDESNILYAILFGGAGGTKFERIGRSITGDESFTTTLRTAYMSLGGMERLHLIRSAYFGHKGAQVVTPTAYFNDGAASTAKTAIAASTNGEHRRVSIKRYARNFALQLVSAAATSIVHEIFGVEMEVGDE